MPTLHVTTRSGETRDVEALAGISVMEALRDATVGDILAMCGGMCSCATCHIVVDPADFGTLLAMNEDENDLLESSDHRTGTSRLSCQVVVTDAIDGLRITVAPED